MAGKLIRKKWTPVLIKRLRGKRTQEEFAKLIGAPKNTVWRWEAGYVVPAAAYVKKLSQIAAKERFLLDWQPIGSITWVGDLEAGSKEIALAFSRSLTSGPRSPAKSKIAR
jgi:transcriptional regulator with XRE-family HTH domain